ncbi:MAG TPA: hypothetical protein VN924_27210 [Bryobacteraceae bacterium]|jgi:hypothetical protein|nr:hypothetical protein [Bryobacteraceae bacterium]
MPHVDTIIPHTDTKPHSDTPHADTPHSDTKPHDDVAKRHEDVFLPPIHVDTPGHHDLPQVPKK